MRKTKKIWRRNNATTYRIKFNPYEVREKQNMSKIIGTVGTTNSCVV